MAIKGFQLYIGRAVNVEAQALIAIIDASGAECPIDLEIKQAAGDEFHRLLNRNRPKVGTAKMAQAYFHTKFGGKVIFYVQDESFPIIPAVMTSLQKASENGLEIVVITAPEKEQEREFVAALRESSFEGRIRIAVKDALQKERIAELLKATQQF